MEHETVKFCINTVGVSAAIGLAVGIVTTGVAVCFTPLPNAASIGAMAASTTSCGIASLGIALYFALETCSSTVVIASAIAGISFGGYVGVKTGHAVQNQIAKLAAPQDVRIQTDRINTARVK